MNHRVLRPVVLILFIGITPTHAQQKGDSVQFLYESCKQELAAGLPQFCLGYLEGVAQFMATNGYERGKVSPANSEAKWYLTEMGLCPGPAIGVPSGGALIQAFLNWAAKHPEHWADHTLLGVVLALRSTWPCSG